MLAIPKSGPLARTTMAYVLAGGRGSRLMELTDRRAKPAVFFGCKSRIIDFALSNALNSGIRRIGVGKHKLLAAHSLIRHLQRGWNFFRVERNESFDILPASQRVSESQWYAGTADAVYQNIDIIESYAPDHIIILAGDHIYKMDYEPMLQMHHERQADVTVGCIEVPRSEGSGFGVMQIDSTDRIIQFLEKPKDPPGMPDKPDKALASMGIYVFATKFLFDELKRDAADTHSSRDFGKDIIPYLVKHGNALAHRFTESCVRSGFEAEAYWRDVGTLDAYWKANIDLTDVIPALDLYDMDWPIWTYGEITPPAKFVCTMPMVGAVRLSARWCPAAASSRVHHCGIRCCSPACGHIPSPLSRTQSSCPTSTSVARRDCVTLLSTAAYAFPKAWWLVKTRCWITNVSDAPMKASA